MCSIHDCKSKLWEIMTYQTKKRCINVRTVSWESRWNRKSKKKASILSCLTPRKLEEYPIKSVALLNFIYLVVVLFLVFFGIVTIYVAPYNCFFCQTYQIKCWGFSRQTSKAATLWSVKIQQPRKWSFRQSASLRSLLPQMLILYVKSRSLRRGSSSKGDFQINSPSLRTGYSWAEGES